MLNLNKIFVVLISLMWLSGSVYGADFVLKAAHNGSAGHPFDDGYQMFKQVIETETNGRVEVQVDLDVLLRMFHGQLNGTWVNSP